MKNKKIICLVLVTFIMILTFSVNSYAVTLPELSITSNHYSAGDKMTLYYDFLSPASVNNKRSGYIGYIATFIGIVLVIKCGPRFVRIIKDNYL